MRTNLTFCLVAIAVSFGCAGGGEPLVTVEKDLTPDKRAVDVSKDVPEAIADLPCVPMCGGRECGDDGCASSCGQCPQELSCSPAGICEAVDCSGKPYTIEGVFATSVEEFAFDAVEVAVFHKIDVDPEEDGCIARVEVDLRRGTGCTLHIRADSSFGANGGLKVQEFTLQVDSQCPGFSDALEGLYKDTGDLDLAEVEMDDLELAVDNVQEWCFPSSLTLHLSGTVYSLDAGAQIDILPTSITIKGSFLSVGDETLSCPCEPSCAGKECGADSCGGSCGACPTGHYCNQGACVEGECVPDCEGKECGPNGCDGTCGDCVEGYYCDQGTCKEGECVPECEGKGCGPNGCGGACGDCGCGEVCEGAACTFHACDDKSCGDDGCGGECGACGEGLACSNGTCINAGCQAQPLALDGDFNTAVSAITFDSVAANVIHKRDVDEWEDGCIASVVLTFKKGLGCALTIATGEVLDLDGYLQVQQVSFSADSQCPGFPDDKEGTYSGVSDLASVWLDLGVNEVPGYDVEESCLNTAMKLHLEGTLHGSVPGKTLQILQTELSISGDFKSLGDYGVSCPCKPSCQGKECGDAGCGATCGSCPGGKSCQAGKCLVVCGDGECGVGEDYCNCSQDCAASTCSGCCQGQLCKTGTSNSECGKGGAVCEACGGGKTCQSQACDFTCGDLVCASTPPGTETCANCPGDCGDCCGNGVCDNGETCVTCPGDCGVCCGNGVCDSGEDKCNCPGDCTGGCAGCCAGTACKAGTANGECGKNGAVCSACSAGATCQNQACAVKCGDGVCADAGGETACTCPQDCGACMGCCSGAACKEGSSNGECGKNGAVCSACSGGTTCQNQACAVKCGDGQCGAGEDKCNCPGDCTGGCVGCCAGMACKAGTLDEECGKNGAACAACSAVDTCQSQVCAFAWWTDPMSGLTWQVKPTGGGMTWSNAKAHCASLSLDGGGWHLPTISELRSLIRNCLGTKTGGPCEVTDSCVAYSCWEKETCASCFGGACSGCCWPDEMLEAYCGVYWSSSVTANPININPPYILSNAWVINFGAGFVASGVASGDLASTFLVRCVR